MAGQRTEDVGGVAWSGEILALGFEVNWRNGSSEQSVYIDALKTVGKIVTECAQLIRVEGLTFATVQSVGENIVRQRLGACTRKGFDCELFLPMN